MPEPSSFLFPFSPKFAASACHRPRRLTTESRTDTTIGIAVPCSILVSILLPQIATVTTPPPRTRGHRLCLAPLRRFDLCGAPLPRSKGRGDADALRRRSLELTPSHTGEHPPFLLPAIQPPESSRLLTSPSSSPGSRDPCRHSPAGRLDRHCCPHPERRHRLVPPRHPCFLAGPHTLELLSLSLRRLLDAPRPSGHRRDHRRALPLPDRR